MAGEKNITELIRGMQPQLNDGEYVFTTVEELDEITCTQSICMFREAEGITLVIDRQHADRLKLDYEFVASWITLRIHSSLEAVGLTAIFSTELAKHNISCNVVSGYYHDHIFVDKNDAEKAETVLLALSENYE